jgi:hypothetical protein
MADYKNIKGFNIQYLDSDPPNPIEGQMWFNSTTQTLKGAEAGGTSWNLGIMVLICHLILRISAAGTNCRNSYWLDFNLVQR